MELTKELGNFDYIGWIPTISGKLFFKHIVCSNSLSDAHSISINHIDSNFHRYVILSTEVDWKDRKDKNRDGCFRVIAIANMDLKGEELEGNLYIYPSEKAHNSRTWDSIDNEIKKIVVISNDKEDVKLQYNAISSKLAGFSEDEFYEIKFTIERRGFCLLKANSTTDVHIDHISSKVLCRQAFYFLKYSLHRHQHHSDRDDSLTTIHSTSDPEVGLSLIDDLKQSLVRMKRDFQSLGHYCLFEATGIVGYAKSLTISCREASLITPEQCETQLSYMSNLSDSLSTIAENAERKITKYIAVSNSYRSIVLLLLSIFAPLSIIYRDEIKEYVKTNGHTQGWLIKNLAIFYSNSTLFITLWAIVILLFYLSTSVIKKHGELRILGIKATAILTPIFHSPRKAKIWWTVILIVLFFTFLYAISKLAGS